MRNLAEQKKLVTPIIWFVFMAILFVVIVGVLFLNVFNMNATIAGYRFYDFMDECEKIDEYDVDDGEYVFYIQTGSKVLIKQVEFSELKENDVIVYYSVDDKAVTTIHTAIYKDKIMDVANDEATYLLHKLDDTERYFDTIASGHLMGVYVTAIPALGNVATTLSATPALMWALIVVLALIMLVVPLVVFVLRLKARRIGSPFPEGVNVNKLKTENLFIYENIRAFIASSGMTIENGYDCDLIYLGDYLFGVLHCTNGHVYVNINKNFQRYDNKIDRSGYVCIPHAGNLETAKKRINSIYKAYFQDLKYKAMAKSTGKKAPKKKKK